MMAGTRAYNYSRPSHYVRTKPFPRSSKNLVPVAIGTRSHGERGYRPETFLASHACPAFIHPSAHTLPHAGVTGRLFLSVCTQIGDTELQQCVLNGSAVTHV